MRRLLPCLSVLVLACSETTSSLDASVRDASAVADAGVVDSGAVPDTGVDAGFDPVSLTVYNNGMPIPDLNIVVSDSEGAFVEFDTTPLDGTWVGEVAPDTTLTVLARGGQNNFIFSYVGVQPGDELHLGERTPGPMGRPFMQIGQATLTLPPPPAATVGVGADIGCGAVGTSTSGGMLPINTFCLTPRRTINAFVFAQNAQNVTVAYALLEDVPVSATGTATLSVTEWRTDVDTFEVRMTNPRPDALFANGFSTMRHDGIGYNGPSSASPIALDGAQYFGRLPPNFAEGLLHQVLISYGTPQGMVAAQTVWGQRLVNGVPNRLEFDMTTDTLPPLLDVILDRTDAERPLMTWIHGGQGAETSHGQVISFPFMQNGVNQGWSVYLPPTAQRWRAPELPERLADFRPDATAMFGDVQVLAVRSNLVGDADEMRQRFGPFFFQSRALQGDVQFTFSFARPPMMP